MTLCVDINHRHGEFALQALFHTESSGVTVFFGPSGSGKTTLLNAIAGLVKPYRGHVRIDGETVFDSTLGISLPTRYRRIGYVFQDARLFPHLSVEGNLLFGWKRAGRPLSRSEIAQVIELLGLGHLLHRRTAKLSGGERQRVAIGRALLTAPRLLLLDEPLTALDPSRREEILRYLERLRDQKRVPMVYVTHSLDEMARLADTIAIFDHGAVAAYGPLYEILSRTDLFPLTGRGEAGAVIRAEVLEHVVSESLTRLRFSGGIITAPLLQSPIGAEIRLRIRARDILLSRVDISSEISANNVLPATVLELQDDDEGTEVSLDCGRTRLVSRITPHSRDRLQLAPGQRVFAIFKTVIIDRGIPVANT